MESIEKGYAQTLGQSLCASRSGSSCHKVFGKLYKKFAASKPYSNEAMSRRLSPSSDSLFDSLDSQLRSSDLSHQLSAIRTLYDSLVRSPSSPTKLRDLDDQWSEFCQQVSAALHRRAVRARQANLESAIASVGAHFRKLCGLKGVKTASNSQSLTQFQLDLDAIRGFAERQDFAQPFVAACDCFVKSFKADYRSLFQSAQRDSAVQSLENSIVEIRDLSNQILEMLVLPPEVAHLTEKISALHPHFEEEEEEEEEEYRPPNLKSFMDSLQSVLREVRSIAESAGGSTTRRLTSVAERLAELANRDMSSEWGSAKRQLESEIIRSRETLKLLNRCHGERRVPSVEEMSGLSKEQLIAVIQNFAAHDDNVLLPIELRVLEGAPREFTELSQKYKSMAQYAEKAYGEVNRLKLVVSKLETENLALRSELEALTKAAEIQDQLDDVEKRERAIAASPKAGKSGKKLAVMREQLAQLANADLRQQIEALTEQLNELRTDHGNALDVNERLRSALNSHSKKSSARPPK
jgi:regulator of replication initiation timing